MTRMSGLERFFLRCLAMARKEVMHILRDPQILAFALGMPLALMFLFGYAVSFDIEHIPFVVVDGDRTAGSRRLVQAFTASGTFTLVAERDDPEEVETLFRSGSAKAALIIPAGFTRTRQAGREAVAQLLLDGSDNTSASITLGYANAVALASQQQDMAALLGTLEPPPQARVHTLFNPGLRSAVFLVPGLIVLILVMVAVMLTSLTLAREYERGSMEQLFATPVGRAEVILGKLGPYFVIGLVQVLLVVSVGVYVFAVPVRGSLLLLFSVSGLFLLAMLMQGLLISAITRSQMLASQVAAISTFLPALLLSGFIFPVETMPWPLRALASLLPARYFVHALRAILLRGNGLEVIWGDVLAILLFFCFVYALAIGRFRREVG